MNKEEIKDSIYREENVVNFMNNELPLYEECWCEGKDSSCWNCDGTGVKITDNGLAIINLIKVAKYIKNKSKETE